MQSPVMSPVLLLLLLLVPAVPARLVTDNPLASNITKDVPEKKCYTPEKAREFCSVLSDVSAPVEKEGLKDEQVYLVELVSAWRPGYDSENHTENWRTGSVKDRNRVLLERRLYTDCTFVVGPDNNTQEFQAHQLLLARASPIFEALFAAKGRTVRVDDVMPNTFKTILQFVYTGDLCLMGYDSTCELLGLATRLQLPKLAETVRSYLWTSMTPKNVWDAYQCGLQQNDEQLTETALQMIQLHTEQILQDQKFHEISRSSLISILSRNYLSISESKLFDATLRWAVSEVIRNNQSPNPESLRAALGPALGYIRFLTFTPSEFSNIQFVSKILTYTESLAVTFNLNSTEEVMPLPEGLSSNNETRIESIDNAYFDVLAKPEFTCKGESIDLVNKENVYNFISTTVNPNKRKALEVHGVQIPTRIKKDDNSPCTEEDEDLSVYLLTYFNVVIASTRYQGLVNVCGKESQNTTSPSEDNELLSVVFPKLVEYYHDYIDPESNKNVKIKVVFNKPGRYPVSLGKDEYREDYNYNHFSLGKYKQLNKMYFFGKNEFVYSYA